MDRCVFVLLGFSLLTVVFSEGPNNSPTNGTKIAVRNYNITQNNKDKNNTEIKSFLHNQQTKHDDHIGNQTKRQTNKKINPIINTRTSEIPKQFHIESNKNPKYYQQRQDSLKGEKKTHNSTEGSKETKLIGIKKNVSHRKLNTKLIKYYESGDLNASTQKGSRKQYSRHGIGETRRNKQHGFYSRQRNTFNYNHKSRENSNEGREFLSESYSRERGERNNIRYNKNNEGSCKDCSKPFHDKGSFYRYLRQQRQKGFYKCHHHGSVETRSNDLSKESRSSILDRRQNKNNRNYFHQTQKKRDNSKERERFDDRKLKKEKTICKHKSGRKHNKHRAEYNVKIKVNETNHRK